MPAALLHNVSHRYGDRRALNDVSFEIASGEIFGVLGPNGGGKTTLFRLLSTLVPLQQGQATLLGYDLQSQAGEIRQRLGVVFQASSLDKKLTVSENIRYQAALYGLRGRELARRESMALEQFGLSERAGELCERLSGGLRRRVELAKGLIHEPQFVLLDEPSTGLDPAARLELWQLLENVRRERGTTVLLTTHILEEAAKAHRLAILDQGRLVALDTPAALQATVGGDTITIRTRSSEQVEARLREEFGLSAHSAPRGVRLEVQDGLKWIATLSAALDGLIEEITLGKPTLEDVFLAKTGRQFREREP